MRTTLNPRRSRLIVGAVSIIGLLVVSSVRRFHTQNGPEGEAVGVEFEGQSDLVAGPIQIAPPVQVAAKPPTPQWQPRPLASAPAPLEPQPPSPPILPPPPPPPPLVVEPILPPDTQSHYELIAPTVYPTDRAHLQWATESQRAAAALFRCDARGECAQNQTRVVLISSHDYVIPMQGGSVGGEAIWAMSTYRALQELGYTVLFSIDIEGARRLYSVFDTHVAMVIAHPDQAFVCFRSPTCARKEGNLGGIPAWKVFSSHFWMGPNNPLGMKWTLSPEDYKNENTYLGYSVEAQCAKRAFVPHAQRKPQVYVLAKFLKFFLPKVTAWPPSYFDDAANATGLEFVMASRDLDGAPRLAEGDLSPSIRNLGAEAQNADTFYELLAHSVALVGVANPALSPTPYDALCLGVPFINPINGWNRNDPQDRKQWNTQHNALRSLSPPIVYHVFQGDREGFVNAIRDAAANPIDSYVLERMKMSAVKARLGGILEKNWRAEAAVLLKAREEGTAKGALFML
ncbi:hypothetical protein C8R46DRAFT_882085 [Mycena filopes]|nr:hypothetical protein C8R46DRAFT_882085 [Mycena filopes]